MWSVRSGSKAALTTPKRHFRSTPNNGHRPTRSADLFRANKRLTRCSKQQPYSITSSARASTDGGMNARAKLSMPTD